MTPSDEDRKWMLQALKLAEKGYGRTSPNPMVGAILIRNNRIIGQGWHRKAGNPHAEIEAFRNAAQLRHSSRNTTLYVTLEPCCTDGRTPPCTNAILKSGVSRVVIGSIDPNPNHAGKSVKLLRRYGISVTINVESEKTTELNDPFNHWIVKRQPWVIAKSAMSLDGKIATRTGDSKWITGDESRRHAMKIRQGCDAILVGINTILKDNPSLSYRPVFSTLRWKKEKTLLRIILDSRGRIPSSAKVLNDAYSESTILVLSTKTSPVKIHRLSKMAKVWVAPLLDNHIDLDWVLSKLGKESVTSLLVEGGGRIHGSFFGGNLVNQAAFYYAPIIIGGKNTVKAIENFSPYAADSRNILTGVRWKRLGKDLHLSAKIKVP
jgi:diaminohydroxyphosphoribosylaminopyrimidine deaminase/5-amino-6-(5-phosphoribosylamino)uracil reductase